MRLSILLSAAALVIVSALPAAAARFPFTTSIAISGKAVITEVARRGCGSRGGPGYRKSNGKCASW